MLWNVKINVYVDHNTKIKLVCNILVLDYSNGACMRLYLTVLIYFFLDLTGDCIYVGI